MLFRSLIRQRPWTWRPPFSWMQVPGGMPMMPTATGCSAGSMILVKTLMKHPYLNSTLTEDGKTIITHNYVNLSMAVGMDNGLMTPVVYNAEKMSLCLPLLHEPPLALSSVNFATSPLISKNESSRHFCPAVCMLCPFNSTEIMFH